ncbi:NAD(P)/FAD-dependent oxidoreductase [Sulfuriferula nivalis]|uniref:Oxidoreductase n=1 Tax=Sulfuriferula nivalis TaxID=2675298 RepID=A0A809S7K9_9PROT|nr:FAD-binding oxidoreductase [Sulfuriferula nivalis]BBO99611.1 oxidoreductase [Sulfuriferula nivalis]
MLACEQKLIQNSYYTDSVNAKPDYPRLEGDLEADVCVVGAGLAGLSAAIELADRGYSVIVLEAETVGWGASGRNGGQIIAGLACDQSVIEKALGFEAARQAWDITISALNLVRERIKRFDIKCDLVDGFLGVAVGARKGAALREWYDSMAQRYHYDTDAEWIDAQDLHKWIDSPRFHSGYYDRRSGHLHPLNYTLGLARGAVSLGVKICEHSPVRAMTKGEPAMLWTDHGSIKARFVVLAGNMYLPEVAPDLAPELARRIMPVGTYIVGTEPLDPALTASLVPTKAAICDTNFVLDYFRFSADNRMLFGGRVSYSTMTPPNLKDDMHKRMQLVFPQLASAKVEYAWGGFVDITMNRAPDFGRVAPNVYYLQGFSGHGVALTGMAGKLVAEAISGQAERLDLMARIPHHDFPGGKILRTPALVLGMAWYRLRDALG